MHFLMNCLFLLNENYYVMFFLLYIIDNRPTWVKYCKYRYGKDSIYDRNMLSRSYINYIYTYMCISWQQVIN